MRRFFFALALTSLTGTFALPACSSDPQTSGADAGITQPTDAGVTADTGFIEEVDDDSGAPGKDAGSNKDAGGDDGILGTLSGNCGTVKAELGKATPSVVHGTLVFSPGETYDKASLSPGGQKLFDTANAGGSSAESEVISFEVLRKCEGASLVKTETEISYAPPDDAGANSITDILVSIDGKRVGVSVTRAYKPSSQSFPDSEVKSLIEKKLEGINRSSVRVLPADKWVKQILHVLSSSDTNTAAIDRVLPTISSDTRADTIVVITTTKGGGFVYCNPDPALGKECP